MNIFLVSCETVLAVREHNKEETLTLQSWEGNIFIFYLGFSINLRSSVQQQSHHHHVPPPGCYVQGRDAILGEAKGINRTLVGCI